jgi:hypothetical protein
VIGASRYAVPFAEKVSASFRLSVALTVLVSAMISPGRALSSTPSDVDAGGCFGRRRRHLCARLRERPDRFRPDVADLQRMPSRQHVMRHGRAHSADADETDLQDSRPSFCATNSSEPARGCYATGALSLEFMWLRQCSQNHRMRLSSPRSPL